MKSDFSRIEWTDYTFNPWYGCTKVSPACDNCYAEAWAKRSGLVEWGAGVTRRRSTPANWDKPIKWDRLASAEGIRRRVFCASLGDVFDTEVDPVWRENLFTVIDLTPCLDWLLLTKRPKVAAAYFDGEAVPPNVWIGTTIENNAMMAARYHHLMRIRARVRFLSMEPLLEPVRLPWGGLPDWIIVGGESGHWAREMPADWARSIRDQAAAHGVAFFMKQMTRKAEIPADLLVRQFPAPHAGGHIAEFESREGTRRVD